MTSPDGGFYSAQDADSEGVEGKYYTFSLNEIIDILGKEKGTEFAKVFDITKGGNFEGMNIPNLLKSNDLKTEFQEEIRKLYNYRKNRFKLHLDDKILLSWNSMMIVSMSMLYRVTRNKKYLNAAQKSQEFIEMNLSDGVRLYTSFRDGKCSKHAFLDDYAFYIAALIELYNSTLDKNYFEKAEKFCTEAVKLVDQRDGTKLVGGKVKKVGKTKTATSKRVVPLNSTAIEMIHELRKEYYFGEDSPLVCDAKGDYANPTNLRKRLYRIEEAAGIKMRGLHAFRHTFATKLINGTKCADGSIKTLNIKAVADILGHTTTEITERYYVKKDTSRLTGITDGFEI